MFPSKPDLVILPFKAVLIGSDNPLILEQALLLLRKHVPIQIELSRTTSAGRSFAARSGCICMRTNPSSASNAAHAATSEKLMPFTTHCLAMMA